MGARGRILAPRNLLVSAKKTLQKKLDKRKEHTRRTNEKR